MSTLGGGSRDLVDHTHSPFGNGEDGGGLQLGKFRLFEPSLPPASRATPKTPRSGHKRRSSFLSARRHTDTAGRHGSKTSLFSNPFRGPLLKGGEFSRLGSTRSDSYPLSLDKAYHKILRMNAYEGWQRHFEQCINFGKSFPTPTLNEN